jgi:hypothetical protein
MPTSRQWLEYRAKRRAGSSARGEGRERAPTNQAWHWKWMLPPGRPKPWMPGTAGYRARRRIAEAGIDRRDFRRSPVLLRYMRTISVVDSLVDCNLSMQILLLDYADAHTSTTLFAYSWGRGDAANRFAPWNTAGRRRAGAPASFAMRVPALRAWVADLASAA